ncbi:hypothetical protein AB0I81_15410 [Nonomuraea sp. NPDC050404]|uniref:hypothetical protein n=1 Tax=Nonomuraea sp. NPDC050404 TaxID=3155783 RepID=UPI0033DAF532
MADDESFEPPGQVEGGLPEHTVFTASMPAATPITAAVERVAGEWLEVRGVEAVAHTMGPAGEDVVQVMVTDQATLDRLAPRLPAEVDGFPVTVRVSGKFRAQ